MISPLLTSWFPDSSG